MGLKAQDTAELFFNDVRIHADNVLGEPGKGFYYLMEGLAEPRTKLDFAQVFVDQCVVGPVCGGTEHGQTDPC